jgi:DNA processing protein
MAAVRLARRPGVGARTFAELIGRYGDPAAALAGVSQAELPFPGHADKAAMAEALPGVEAYLAAGGRGAYLGARDYPPLLAAAPEPPPYLFFRGPAWPPALPAVAIVGPRDPSSDARAFAFALAGDLAGQGVTIVSGGARGIDAAAHEGALAAGGQTVIVTATGIDRHYPPEHGPLFERVAERGLILTELLPGAPPRRDFFPTRNRIVTGLSQALVVMGGRRRSGTFSSFRHMRRLGRPVYVWGGARGDEAELVELAQAEGAISIHEPNAALVCPNDR